MMTRRELVDTLRKRRVENKFIEANPMDVTTHCHFFTIKDDVEAGYYPFEYFIDAHAELHERGEPYTIGEVRLLAKQSFARAISRETVAMAECHQAGTLFGKN